MAQEIIRAPRGRRCIVEHLYSQKLYDGKWVGEGVAGQVSVVGGELTDIGAVEWLMIL